MEVGHVEVEEQLHFLVRLLWEGLDIEETHLKSFQHNLTPPPPRLIRH